MVSIFSTIDSVTIWLGQKAPEILINLIAAAIGGTLVWVVATSRRRIKLVKARRFWKTLHVREVLVVIGTVDQSEVNQWDHAGLVGFGDFQALIDIQTSLNLMGFKSRVAESAKLTAADFGKSLVLIGGPDSNSATFTLMGMLANMLIYDLPKSKKGQRPSICDQRTGRRIESEYDELGDVVVDYGLIVRAPNPLAPVDSEVVIVAGCWGHGTAAAAGLMGSRKFVQDKQVRSGRFEVLVRSVVMKGDNYNSSIVEVHPLNAVEGHGAE